MTTKKVSFPAEFAFAKETKKTKKASEFSNRACSLFSLPKSMSGRYLEDIIPRDKPGAGTGGGLGGSGGGAGASGGRHAGGRGGGGGGRSGFGRGMNRGGQPQAHRGGGVDSNNKRKGNSGLEITFDPAAVR